MARRSHSTFGKREKEKARFEKRQSKLARRQKKAEGGLPGGGDDPQATQGAMEGTSPYEGAQDDTEGGDAG
jgi:hypothetical protein